MPLTWLSMFALSITSIVTSNVTVNQTDSPSGVNNTSVNVTEAPTQYFTPTQSEFFETTTEELLTETTLPNTASITDSTLRDSTFTDVSTTESATSSTPILPKLSTGNFLL